MLICGWFVKLCYTLLILLKVFELFIVCLCLPEPSFSLNNVHCLHIVTTHFISSLEPFKCQNSLRGFVDAYDFKVCTFSSYKGSGEQEQIIV